MILTPKNELNDNQKNDMKKYDPSSQNFIRSVKERNRIQNVDNLKYIRESSLKKFEKKQASPIKKVDAQKPVTVLDEHSHFTDVKSIEDQRNAFLKDQIIWDFWLKSGIIKWKLKYDVI